MTTAFSNAKRILEQRRLHAEHQRKILKNQIFDAYPPLKEVEEEIQKTSLSIVKNIFQDQSDSQILKDALETLVAKRKMLLSQYSLPENYLDTVYQCTVCLDKGVLEDGTHCSCFLTELRKERSVTSGLEPFMNTSGFDHFDLSRFSSSPYGEEPKSAKENMQSILQQCKDYLSRLEQEKKGLLFLGGTGTGKSFLLQSLGKALISKDKDVLYLSAFELVDTLHEFRFSRNHDAESFSPFRNCDILIIDDLGAEIVSEYSKSELLNLLDYRINHNRKVFLSSNLSLSEIGGQYGSRFTSRLLNQFYIYKCLGQDLRTEL